MATIKEDYVSFETAKLLKEKGFNEKCDKYYPDHTYKSPIYINDGQNSNSFFGEACSAPTQQMAMKYLRKVHTICIVSMPVVTDDDGEAGCLWYYIISRKLEVLHDSECLYGSSEIALNDAIKYCLENLI